MNAVDALLMEVKPTGGDQADLLRRMLTGENPCASARATGDVTLVVSPKGGCGQTTIAVNMASARARQGARVLLVDADRVSPGVALFLRGMQVYERDARGAEVRWRSRRGRLCTLEVACADPAMLRSLAGEYDAVVVDAGPGIPPSSLVSLSHRVVVVMSAEFTAWRSATGLLARVSKMCEESFTGLSCVFNRARDREVARLVGAIESADVARALAHRLVMPTHRALAVAPILGVPPVLPRRTCRGLARLCGENRKNEGREITSWVGQVVSGSDHATSVRASGICNVGA